MTTPAAPLIIVMGVSASGKSTVGELLAKRLDIVYADGDDFHSQANIAKMQGGTPLTDADRWPWLDAVGGWLHERAGDGAVISCSALKHAYRDRLRAAAPGLLFLYLCGGEEELRRRVAKRKHHFMPASLLDSQLATLEPLAENETGIAIELTLKPERIVAAFVNYLDEVSTPAVED